MVLHVGVMWIPSVRCMFYVVFCGIYRAIMIPPFSKPALSLSEIIKYVLVFSCRDIHSSSAYCLPTKHRRFARMHRR